MPQWLRVALALACSCCTQEASGSQTWAASSLRQSYPENCLWTRYTQPRVMIGSDHMEEESISTGHFPQRLDHVNVDDSRTWMQSYEWTNASYQVGGPAFIMLAGTSDYRSDWLRAGHMADLARQLHADRFYFSTRFYSPPYPTDNVNVSSLDFLSTEHILQDVSALLQHLRDEGRIRVDQRVVLFGGGFAGAIATWARQRFPELVHAAVASSAVLEPRVQLAAYFPVVDYAASVLHGKHLQCADNLRKAFVEAGTLLDTKEGRQIFNNIFEPCTPWPLEEVVSPLDRAQTIGFIASIIADLVQENVEGEDGDLLERPCLLLKQHPEGAVRALGDLLSRSGSGRCSEFTLRGLLLQTNQESWEHPINGWGVRPWLWQQCTELGLFATSSSEAFPYSNRITMDFHKALCAKTFGSRYDYSSLLSNMRDLLDQYGGRAPEVHNVIFIKGDLDPWGDSSPADHFSTANHPVINVRRASHAHDMFQRDPFDPPRLKSARKKVAAVLTGWLKHHD